MERTFVLKRIFQDVRTVAKDTGSLTVITEGDHISCLNGISTSTIIVEDVRVLEERQVLNLLNSKRVGKGDMFSHIRFHGFPDDYI